MAEVEGGGGAGAKELAGGDGGGDGGGAGGGPSTGSGQAPEWIGALPEELRGDATLSRFADVPALARGFIDTQKLARSKLAVPAADAGDDVWNGVWDALGRPKEATGYGDFGLDPLPETASDADREARTAMVGAYQAELHKLGVPPRLATSLVKADLARLDAAQEAYYAQGAQEVEALKTEMKGKGVDYDTEKAAARSVFLKIFGEDAGPIADELDRKVGSGRLLRGMMKLAKITGEHGKVGGDEAPIGDGGSGDPEADLKALHRDAGWRAKLNAGDPATKAQAKRLREAAQRQALRNPV